MGKSVSKRQWRMYGRGFDFETFAKPFGHQRNMGSDVHHPCLVFPTKTQRGLTGGQTDAWVNLSHTEMGGGVYKMCSFLFEVYTWLKVSGTIPPVESSDNLPMANLLARLCCIQVSFRAAGKWEL